TDVTGFGLAGHLGGICRASGLGARLDLDALPYFSGARDLAARGVASSLAASNRTAAAPLLTDLDQAADALMFDPQTAGGLLAAVPEAVADEAIATGAWRIGQMLEGPARIELS
ncbi:MAG: AIR synthase-related protein, partial [Pseudomonadota bacterium]